MSQMKSSKDNGLEIGRKFMKINADIEESLIMQTFLT